MAGISPSSVLSVFKSEEYGGSVFIMASGRPEPILRIAAGRDKAALIAIHQSRGELSFWSLAHEEVGGPQDLGEAIRRILSGKATLEVYELGKEILPQGPEGENKDQHNFDPAGKKKK